MILAVQGERDIRVSRLLALHQEETEVLAVLVECQLGWKPDWAGFQAQKLEAQKKAQLASERPGLVPLSHCPACTTVCPLCPIVCCCE